MKDNLIDLLLDEQGRFFSGEEAAKTLGVSRQALWKKIAHLRKKGWKVEGVPGKGYRLASIPSHFEYENLRTILAKTGSFEEIHLLESVDSTNTFLLRRQEKGIKSAVAIADTQHAGRGRLGRSWFSPKGKNLSMSLLLPLRVSPALSPAITLIAGLSVAVAINSRYEIPCKVKWPNDVYVSGKKICGILTEMIADFDETKSVVIGIGVNVNSTRDDFPEEIRDSVISLKECTGKDIMRAGVADAIVEKILENMKVFQRRGLEAFLGEWERYSYLTGKTVIVGARDGEIRGTAAGIHPERGYLIVEDEEGRRIEFVSGDIKEVQDG